MVEDGYISGQTDQISTELVLLIITDTDFQSPDIPDALS